MQDRVPSVFQVAAFGWLVPGGGHWLLGEKTRGLTIGITVVALFLMGITVGGVRVVEVPRFNDRGQFNVMLIEGRVVKGKNSQTIPLSLIPELREKPWSLLQVLTGPVAVAGGAASVWASRTSTDDGSYVPRGARPHARMWEIPVLYTAVAGLMNLIAIVDAAHRARKLQPV